MLPQPLIRSSANPAIRRARACLAGREPTRVVLEGDRLVDDALAAGWTIDEVLVAGSRPERAHDLEARGCCVLRVADPLLQRVSSLATSPGVLALGAVPPPFELARLERARDPLVLVVGGVADPGNLGALARSAEAAGAACAVFLRGGASPWNPKALRGSMGSLLRLPVLAEARPDDVRRALDELGFRHRRAATRGGTPPAEVDWSGPIALWIGSETGSLPGAAADAGRVSIPMAAGVESLNVTAAATLLLFAAARVELER